MVLFLGVTILLASTYVTLYSTDQAQPKHKSVVKIAMPNLRPVKDTKLDSGSLDKIPVKNIKLSDQDHKKSGGYNV